MTSKTARKSSGAGRLAPKEQRKISSAEAVAEIRSLRAGGLFVGNMEYVDALLAGHDRLEAEVNRLLQELAAERRVEKQIEDRDPGVTL